MCERAAALHVARYPADTPSWTTSFDVLPVFPEPQSCWKSNPLEWPVLALTLGSEAYSQAELLALMQLPGLAMPAASSRSSSLRQS
jgi:hypothetical protein